MSNSKSWERKNLLNPLYWFSPIATTCLIVLIFTGVLLCFWYEPSPERAYESIVYTSQYVYFGQVLLSLHHWATHLLLISLILHMLRVFFMGTYKGAWRYAWVSGALFLIIAVLFVFTGYLLRWDEVGYWSIRVTTSIVAYTPFIGGYLERLILGGGEITSRTLARFFMMHIFLLPMLSLLAMGSLYYYIKKTRFYWAEIGIGMLTIGFLMLYSVLDPFQLTPKPSAELQTALKPIWLFLWLYVVERGIGMISPSLNFLNIVILIIVALLITLLPYIDKGKETDKLKKRRAFVGIFVLALFIVLTLIGYLWKPPIG